MSNLFAPGVTAAEGALTAAATESTPGKRGPYKKNKERKKREKDPNAPKRPLTAYFLYSQHARDIVKGDFAKQSKTPAAQEVSDEILRRWTSMDLEARKVRFIQTKFCPYSDDAQPWKELYERNATKYRQDVADYKAKTGAAVEDQGDDDVTETAAAPAPPTVESLAPAVRAALDSAPATAEKKTKGKGKKKETAAAPAQASPSPSAQLTKVSAVPVPSADVPTKSSKRKSEAEKTDEPPKKRKRKSKAEKEAEEAAAAAAKPAETPAEGKKKRKSTKKDKSSD